MREFALVVNSWNIWVILSIYSAMLVLLGIFFRRSHKLRPYTGQLVVLSAIVIMTALFVVLTFAFPIAKGKMASATNASTIVKVWAALLVPIAIWTLMSILKGNEGEDKPFGSLARVGTVIAIVVVSLLLFKTIGYYISSAMFILAVMFILHERKPVLLISLPVGWMAFTYIVFARLLNVPLPVGSLFSGF